MKTTKFRGLSIETSNKGEWAVGSLFHDLRDGIYSIWNEQARYWMRVDPATVGQFTGLTDKNGKEIYEGDMIHAMGSLDLIVKWDSDNACFFADYDATRDVIDDDRDDFCNACDFSIYYAIGNIHSNPELLKNE